MSDWQQKQAKFDQLPIDVETINYSINHLNTIVSSAGNIVSGMEADMRVLTMLLSRVEKCVQEQTKALNEVRDVIVASAKQGSGD